MWISLFSIVTAISIGLAVGAMILESGKGHVSPARHGFRLFGSVCIR